MKILEINDLCVTYIAGEKRIKAVDHVSFAIDEGDSLGIVGESGSGKSTMAMAMLRLLDPRYTEITGAANYRGENLLTVDARRLSELRWKDIAVVFQKSMNSLSPVHRIGEQFEDIYRVHEPKASKKEIRERVEKLFAMVNLAPRVYNLYPHELSGGMLQRTSIALSLLFHPKILIMDEATTALDVVTQGQILSEIKKLEKSIAVTRMMITHDLSVVATSCQKIIVLYAGQLMEFGYVRDVLANPRHPYTEGLVRSFPSLHGKKEELLSIPGSLPDLANPPRGCIFAPRCPYATDQCRAHRPEPRHIDDLHVAACWRVKGGMQDA